MRRIGGVSWLALLAAGWSAPLTAEQAIDAAAQRDARSRDSGHASVVVPPGTIPAGQAAPQQQASQSAEAEQTPAPDEIFKQVFGKERPAIAPGRYQTMVDGAPTGVFNIDPAGGGSIEAAFVGEVLLPLLTDEHRARANMTLSGKPRVTFDELRAFGLSTSFDSGTLMLVIDVPMTIRSARVLTLRGGRRRGDGDVVTPAGISAYASFRAAVDLVAQSDRGHTGLSGFVTDADLGVTVSGVALQGRVSYAERGSRRWTRSDVRATYDDVARMIRYEVGDLSVGRRSYQQGGRIAGISARREFRINPYLNIRPAGQREFTLERAARIDVVVNGHSSRTFTLPPGRYSLRDFALVPSAANDIDIRITYASGETDTISFPAFYDIDLLDNGLLEFAFNAGFPYDDQGGVRHYDTDDFNLLGYARYGISDVLTAGASIEGSEDFTNLGLEGTWASPVGSLFVSVASNVRSPSLASSAARVLYSWRSADTSRGRSLDAQLTLTGRDYRTLNDLFGQTNPTVLSTQVRAGQMFGSSLRAQVSAGYDKTRPVDLLGALPGGLPPGVDPGIGPSVGNDFGLERGDRWFVGTSASYQLPFGTVTVGLDYVRARRNSGLAANLSFFVPLGSGTVAATYSTRENAASLEYSRLAALGVGSFGFSGGVERRDGADREYVRGTYVGNRFESFADVRRIAADGNIRDTRAAFGLGTALVMADGAFAVSRPVINGFAIVEPPAKGGYAIEPRTGFGSSDTTYTAYSDWLGPGVVPDIQPYFDRSIQIDQKGSRAAPGAGTIFNLKPGFRSGYRLNPAKGAAGAATVVGVLVGPDRAPLTFASGEARKVGAKEAQPVLLFTNGAGRFFLNGLEEGASYDLTIQTPLGPLKAVIDVPRGIEGPARIEPPVQAVPQVEKSDAM